MGQDLAGHYARVADARAVCALFVRPVVARADSGNTC